MGCCFGKCREHAWRIDLGRYWLISPVEDGGYCGVIVGWGTLWKSIGSDVGNASGENQNVVGKIVWKESSRCRWNWERTWEIVGKIICTMSCRCKGNFAPMSGKLGEIIGKESVRCRGDCRGKLRGGMVNIPRVIPPRECTGELKKGYWGMWNGKDRVMWGDQRAGGLGNEGRMMG